MSVKRYSVWGDEMFDEKHALNPKNSMVHLMVMHEDYAALEARCAALAAENAGLKDLARGWANATDDRLFEEHGEIFHDSIDACEEELITICPATDAFLAEVRASELDILAGVAETMMVKFANQGASEIPEAKGWEMIHRQASQRAAQLRKGVQS